jgi:hypothetical protein
VVEPWVEISENGVLLGFERLRDAEDEVAQRRANQTSKAIFEYEIVDPYDLVMQ